MTEAPDDGWHPSTAPLFDGAPACEPPWQSYQTQDEGYAGSGFICASLAAIAYVVTMVVGIAAYALRSPSVAIAAAVMLAVSVVLTVKVKPSNAQPS